MREATGAVVLGQVEAAVQVLCGRMRSEEARRLGGLLLLVPALRHRGVLGLRHPRIFHFLSQLHLRSIQAIERDENN